MRAVRERRRSLGQALTEIALVGPLLLILLVGSAQVGVIAYGNVTIDTAAREGARVASERPLNATSFSGNTHTFQGCAAADTSTNFAVQAVCRNAGVLNTSNISVTITKNIDPTSYVDDSPVHLAAIHMNNTCSGNNQVVSGVVYNLPSGATANITTNADTSINIVDSPSAPGYPAYSGCFPPSNGAFKNSGQTLTATVNSGCNTYSASVTGVFPPQQVNFTLTATSQCPQPIATTTTLSVSGNGGSYGTSTSVLAGQPVTFNAVVAPASGGTPSGSVTFTDTTSSGTSTLGSVALASGSAQLTTTSLGSGSHTVTATYLPDATHASSTSNTVSVLVQASARPTTTTLTANPNVVQQNVNVTFTATVANAPNQPLTGTVTFIDTTGTGTTTLGSAPIGSNGTTAQFTTSTLPVGTNQVVAQYGGDTVDDPSTSANATVTVVAAGSGGGGAPGPSPFACENPPGGLSTMYLEVDVTYPVPVFVPLVGNVFQNGPGVRTITVTQFIRIEPCSLTNGQ